jgi:hypothetical protein
MSGAAESPPRNGDHPHVFSDARPPSSTTNGDAVAGMVLGIISLFTLMILIGFLLALIGLGLSIAGLVSARRAGGVGTGFAVTGLVTSGLTTTLLVVWIAR